MSTTDEAAGQLQAALAATEAAIKAVLQAEAQQSVDKALERLAKTSGPVSLDGLEVEVVIHSGGNASKRSAGRPKQSARRSKRRPAARKSAGRPGGPVREAVLGAFGGQAAGDALDAQAIRGHLAERGVSATEANLHQHLGRLVKAGELERAGRGLYRRAVRAAEG